MKTAEEIVGFIRRAAALFDADMRLNSATRSQQELDFLIAGRVALDMILGFIQEDSGDDS